MCVCGWLCVCCKHMKAGVAALSHVLPTPWLSFTVLETESTNICSSSHNQSCFHSGTVGFTGNWILSRQGGVTCSGLCSGLEVSCNILRDCVVCGNVCPCYQICLHHYNISLCKFTAAIYDMIKIIMEMDMSLLTHQIAAATETIDPTAMVDDSRMSFTIIQTKEPLPC